MGGLIRSWWETVWSVLILVTAIVIVFVINEIKCDFSIRRISKNMFVVNTTTTDPRSKSIGTIFCTWIIRCGGAQYYKQINIYIYDTIHSIPIHVLIRCLYTKYDRFILLCYFAKWSCCYQWRNSNEIDLMKLSAWLYKRGKEMQEWELHVYCPINCML